MFELFCICKDVHIKKIKTILFIFDIREEYRLRVFENLLLRRMFGPKREEVAGGWRKFGNEDLYNLYS
jgi:hypothetical protein